MPLARWRAKVDAAELEADPAQEAAAVRLDRLAREIEAVPAPKAPRARFLGFLDREPPRPAAPRGVYLYGGVGRGKSMLMDLLYAAVRTAAKRRVHFHEFMLEVQRRLHALRQEGGSEDPLRGLAATLAGEQRLLCFDELEVVSIADAMILGRLFEGLLEGGVTVVATSNRPPHDLYKDGLNRDRFLPFIDLLLSRIDVVALDGPTDYRLNRLREVAVYHAPPGAAADAALDRTRAILADGVAAVPDELAVGTRRLGVPLAADGVADFPFAALCELPLGAADYLALTDRYHSVILRGVPVLTPDKRNEARRFITLVDALYERRAMLFVSAAAAPEELYARGDGAFEFQRTVSRLQEMRSADYLERCRARDAAVKVPFVPFALTSDLI